MRTWALLVLYALALTLILPAGLTLWVLFIRWAAGLCGA